MAQVPFLTTSERAALKLYQDVELRKIHKNDEIENPFIRGGDYEENLERGFEES